MVLESWCIQVYSDMNTWIDFVIIPNASEDFDKAKKVIEKAYHDWWELDDAEFEPLGDWVLRCLTENEIEFDIYWKDDDKQEV